jgi:hypothetical protein
MYTGGWRMGAVRRDTLNDALLRLSYSDSRNIKRLLQNWGGLESLSYKGDKVATCILADLKLATGIDLDLYDREHREKFDSGASNGVLSHYQFVAIAYCLVVGYQQDAVAFMMGVDQSVISRHIATGIQKIQEALGAFEEEE